MFRNIFCLSKHKYPVTTRPFSAIPKWNKHKQHLIGGASLCNSSSSSDCINTFLLTQFQYQPYRGKKDDSNLSALFKPVPVKTNPDDISIGAELTGKLNKSDLLKILNKFTQKREIKLLCIENGLDSKYTFLLRDITLLKK